ncbi:hypothetical protein PIB30_081010 [Stylosanthes scabra]|uniref:Uncharacterized protein n=1 Tax=Stylosanthes scabra TaxID=79078 RepID=A0ABU6TR55_9FABA|nr:hypothetical protein [Stylosanthes scabra]
MKERWRLKYFLAVAKEAPRDDEGTVACVLNGESVGEDDRRKRRRMSSMISKEEKKKNGADDRALVPEMLARTTVRVE